MPNYKQYSNPQNRDTQRNDSLSFISAPYNFVPLQNKVYFPNWADQISIDIPFSDGLSGELVCEMVAESPIYTRNAVAKNFGEDNKKIQDPEYQSFFKFNDQYMIPGSSIKGMIRSVLEIISLGKIGNFTDDKRYSIRDLNNHIYSTPIREAKAGFLKLVDGKFQVTLCGVEEVTHDELISYYKKKYHKEVDIRSPQLACEKYKTWGNDLTYNGQTLVFTGQPTRSKPFPEPKRGNPKYREFLFCKTGQVVPLEKKVFDEFEFIHSENGNPNKDWEHWKKQFLLKGKEVPVFFLMSDKKITKMGLAKMFRLAYTNTIHESINHTTKEHLNEKPDLAECIFGYTGKGKNKQTSLKGRVSITTAVCTHKVETNQPVEMILGSPKPSYYPNYIEQPSMIRDTREYKTFMDKDCKIRGWKRYPARQNMPELSKVPKEQGEVKQEKVKTALRALGNGTKFQFKIKFHNLRPIELGALYWALTWGSDPNLVHKIGMAKPFGYGSVKINVSSTNIYQIPRTEISDTKKKLEESMNLFLEEMKKANNNSPILNSDWMKQLKSMANPNFTALRPQGSNQTNKLKYLTLDPVNRNNEYVIAKNNKLRLEPHS